MRYTMIFLALLFSLAAHADTSITALPSGSAAASGVNDVFPFVDVTSLTTKKMKLSDLKNLPSFSTFNAATATALAANPTDCAGGQFANAIAANGNLTCSTPSGGGSSGLTVSSVSSSGALTAGSPVNYKHVACDASGGAIVQTLPLCAGNIGQVFNLKKVDSGSNPCSFARAGSDLIDGQTSVVAGDEQYLGKTIVCRAAGFWDIL